MKRYRDRAAAAIRITAVARHRHEPVTALRNAQTGTEIVLPERSRLSIGSSRTCDLRLDDTYVSGLHCILERQESAAVVVRDQGSTNGTFVNGNRVDSAELRPGTLLRLGKTTLVAQGQPGRAHATAFEQLRGSDPAFQRAIDRAMQAAITDCSVLILGETGTGKELVARAIHEASGRSHGPLVAINCGAFSSQLIGSELFGHEKGAFTGAVSARDGVFVHANQGTLFLDELGELPLDQQPHLLRAIETRRVRRLGSNHEQPIDVRLISATNRIQGLGTEASPLRLDLYHRLATVVIELPPLRKRPADVPILVEAFMQELAHDFGYREISRITMRGLRQHDWPGNVRELRGAILRAMAMCPYELTLDQLLPHRYTAQPEPAPAASRAARSTRPPGVLAAAAPIKSLSWAALDTPPKRALRAREPGAPLVVASDELSPIDIMMREEMLDALDRYGSIRRAALSLGMPKSTFADRARRLGIQLRMDDEPATRRKRRRQPRIR